MASVVDRSESLFIGTARWSGASDPFPEPGAEPNYAPDRQARIDHIDVVLSLWPTERRFQGRAVVSLTPFPGSNGTARLDLDEVTVESVALDGEPAEFTHTDGVLVVSGLTGPCKVEVSWTGANPARGLYFTGPTSHSPDRQHMAWTQCQDEDGHFVLPCHDRPGVKHPWTIELRAPEGYTLLSNGKLVDSGTVDGLHFTRWEQLEPMPVYLFNAVAARLTTIEASEGRVPVRYLVPVGEEEHVTRSMGRTPEMIDVFSDITGVTYPWPRYDQVVVHDFVFGGMENVACTTMTDLLLVDEKAELEWNPDGLVSHELAHQWFGDLVTCQDWSQAWLNESWATFMETVWWAHAYGEQETQWYRHGQARGYLAEDSSRYRRPIVSYRFREPIDVFDRHLYEKGGVIMHHLRTELGDEAFWGGVKLYLDRHAHGTVHSRHFQRAMEDATGRNLDRFFDQWIFGAGHPALEVGLSEEDGLLLVSVKQTQSGDETAEVFHFRLRIDLVDGDENVRTVWLPVNSRERTFAVPVDASPALVRVDPGFDVLSTIKLSGPRRWLLPLVDDAAPVLASRAAAALLEGGSREGFAAVASALTSHEFWGVRVRIAELLGGRGGADAEAALIAGLDDEDARVRRAICSALGNFRSAEAATALIEVLNSGPDTWQLQAAALQALGQTRDERASVVLKSHLDVDSWGEQVRSKALLGLGATRSADVLDLLVERTTERHTERVRAAAASALGQLADEVADVRRDAVEALCVLLKEGDFRARLTAASALARVRDSAATPALQQTHRSDPDGRIRRAAFEALRTIGKGRTTEAGLAGLRARVEALDEANHKLRQRLERLEPSA